MNGNRKLTVPFVGLFLLLVLGWKTLVVVSVNLLQLLTRPSFYIISFFFFLFARPTDPLSREGGRRDTKDVRRWP